MVSLLLLSVLFLVNAQIPPRLNIPGAVPVPIRQQFRNEKPGRVRRPITLRAQDFNVPAITPRTIEEPKPVIETEEDEAPDAFLPLLLREQQLAAAQQTQFQQTAAQFFNSEPNSIQVDAIPLTLGHEEPLQTQPSPSLVSRFAERPIPTSSRPQINDFGIGSNVVAAQRFGGERPQVSSQPTVNTRPNIIRSRPPVREQRPQYESQSLPERNAPPPPVSRPRPKPIQSRPIEYNIVSEDRDTQPKRQRPVAQTLRKWRDENDDGSITWGYENDDGSFKEEIIGTDCITKGTYGYVDPDGNKREYHYETGIRCDPNNRQTDEDLQENGFINYEENKAVLPNGIEIDMAQLGKKKSKRPGAILREQPAQALPQNQYYRN